MKVLNMDEVSLVDGGNFGEAVGAGLVAAGGVAIVAGVLSIPTGGVGGALVYGGAFLGGIALYYLTD